MLFNSLDFAIFLPIVFLLYWAIGKKNIRTQNLLIVLGSYFFYGWWDWRFLFLIAFSTLVDFTVGILLNTTENELRRKLLLYTSLGVNLGLLGFFKYYNFFLDNFVQAFSFFGYSFEKYSIEGNTLNIILPVGISFYTFQTLSYTIDVYQKRIKPSKNIIAFTAFVSFFPQLVAGPIERATHLLPQFLNTRTFDYEKAKDGMRQILWGLFKKIVIADNCAYFVNLIFEDYTSFSGSTLLLGAVLFAFQIYGDFSGYSDIAIGTARLFGFNLMQNFAFPYFSRDIAEFWRRWHISLSTWFRDYVYIPLGGSKVSKIKVVRNVFIIFLVSGFWHGANWTFIVWGGLNALYFLPLLLQRKNRENLGSVITNSFFPSFKTIWQIATTFILTTFAWVFFRAENVTKAIEYINRIFSFSFFKIPEIFPVRFSFFLFFLLLVEWMQRDRRHGLDFSGRKINVYYRWLLYLFICFMITMYYGKENTFIYFQF